MLSWPVCFLLYFFVVVRVENVIIAKRTLEQRFGYDSVNIIVSSFIFGLMTISIFLMNFSFILHQRKNKGFLQKRQKKKTENTQTHTDEKVEGIQVMEHDFMECLPYFNNFGIILLHNIIS